MTVLRALKERGPMKYKDIVAIVGFSTTTSRCLKAMEQQRIVSKRVLEEPYRPVEYKITKKGEELLGYVLGIEMLTSRS